MKKLILLLIIYYSLLTVTCFSQPSITWQRLYDGQLHFFDGGMSSCMADSNNFYIGGYTTVDPNYYRRWVLKLNPYGDTIWTRIVTDTGGQVYAMVSSGDGGCVITGASGGTYAIKLNSSGNIVWNKSYGVNSVQSYDIKRTLDGGYICCGREVYSTNAIIVKIDSLGNQQWQQVYPSGVRRSFRSILQTVEGNYVVTGDILDSPYGTVKTVIAKIDSVGNVLWEKDHVLNGGNSGGVNIYQNGYEYIIGCTGVWLLKTDSIGNILYFKTIESIWRNLGSMRIDNNKYIFATSIHSDTGGPVNGKVLITDTMGNIIKEKIFPTPDFIDFRSILPMDNGDFVFSGIANFNIGIGTYEDVYTVRTDSNLNYPPISVVRNHYRIPKEFILHQNYPNPFNPVTKIRFDVSSIGVYRNTSVQIIVYDILGREITTLVNQEMKPGSYEVKFDGSNYASGLYFYRIEAGNYLEVKKMVLLK